MNTAPFHRSMIRPLLLMGCDRELLMFSGLIAFALAAQGQTFMSLAYAVLLWFLSLFLLRLAAKADPFMRDVYLRHRRYAKYYPPRSTPYRINLREY